MPRQRMAAIRLGFWTVVSALLVVATAAIAYVRYTRGLGAVTHLSDSFP